MDYKKSIKIIGTAGLLGILAGSAYVIGKNIWNDKNAPIAIFKYTAETEKIERLK
jgi:hypothetical protein